MVKSIVICLVLLFLSCELQAATVSLDFVQEEGLYATVVSNITEYRQKNSHLNLKTLEKRTLGAREQGDSLAIAFGEMLIYPILNDLSSHESYADSVRDRVINFVDVRFEENAAGKVYLAGGGVGQNYVSLVVEAPSLNSRIFNYQVYVYGKK